MASKGRFSSIQAPTTVVHSNLDQEIIQITEDRLRLVLKDHLDRVEEGSAWQAPLGLLIGVVAAFATADFRDAYFKAATWEAIFIITGVVSTVWLARASYRAVTSPSIGDIVSKIKSGYAEGKT